MFHESIEDELARHKRRVRELELQEERLVAEQERSFQDMGITSEQLYSFSTNRDNFSSEEWAVLEDARQRLETDLRRRLGNIRKQEETKSALKERSQVQSNWVFVK